MTVRRASGVLRYLVSLAVVALVYYLAGRIGLELAYLDGAVAALWPPAGVGLAVLFLFGIRLWPGPRYFEPSTERTATPSSGPPS